MIQIPVMIRSISLLTFISLLLFSFSQNKESVEKYDADYMKADLLFNKAENLSQKANYNEELEEKLNNIKTLFNV